MRKTKGEIRKERKGLSKAKRMKKVNKIQLIKDTKKKSSYKKSNKLNKKKGLLKEQIQL